jgi:hypothetical protein
VQCAKAAAGTRSGTSGATIGKAQLTWAFSNAAGVCLREHPAGQIWLARWATKQGQGTAFTRLAHTWARAGYSLFKRTPAFDRHPFLQAYRRAVGALNASLHSRGMSRVSNARQGITHGVVERP